MKVLFVFFLLLPFQNAQACFPVRVPLETRISTAKHVAIGFVTGISLHEFEANIGKEEKEIQSGENYTIKVTLTNNLKGKFAETVIDSIILSCSTGKADLREKIWIFFDGDFWFVQPVKKQDLPLIQELIKNNFR